MSRFLLVPVAALALSAAALAAPELVVTAEQRAALGIELSDAQAVSRAPVAVVPAVIRLPGDTTQAIVVPFAGTVVRVLAQEGQTVRQGEPLLQLRSHDFLQSAAEGHATAAQVKVLRARVERDRALVAEGIAPARQLQESEAQLRAAEAQASSYGVMLSSTRAAPGSSADYLLLAPVAGVLAQGDLLAGDAAAAGRVAFFLYGGAKVWADGQLGQRLIEQVVPGLQVEAGDPPHTGRVIAVGRTVDPGTRGVLVRAELEAGPGLRPGQVTELQVFAPAEPGTVLLPASAVTRLEGKDTVFLATGQGFVPVAVEVGVRTERGVTVRGPGLDKGRVASAGVGALKAMAQGN